MSQEQALQVLEWLQLCQNVGHKPGLGLFGKSIKLRVSGPLCPPLGFIGPSGYWQRLATSISGHGETWYLTRMKYSRQDGDWVVAACTIQTVDPNHILKPERLLDAAASIGLPEVLVGLQQRPSSHAGPPGTYRITFHDNDLLLLPGSHKQWQERQGGRQLVHP